MALQQSFTHTIREQLPYCVGLVRERILNCVREFSFVPSFLETVTQMGSYLLVAQMNGVL
jgi:hypothetical protein